MEKGLTSVIILNWDGLDDTRDCLESLKTMAGAPYEAVVVDNGSGERDVRWLEANWRRLSAKIVVRRGLSFAAANNLGVRESTGEYVCILNNDTIILNGFLRALLEAVEKDITVGIAGAQILSGRGTIQFSGGIVEDLETGKCNHMYDYLPVEGEPRECDYVTGACMFMRRDLWDGVGGFDERFDPIFYEDVDLSLRVRKLGYRCVVVPNALLTHKVSRTLDRDPERKKKAIEVNRQRFIGKWGQGS